MTRPYAPMRGHGRFYTVGSVNRPNKLAAGMQYTHDRRVLNLARSVDSLITDAHARAVLDLLVYGTTDTLAHAQGNRMRKHRARYYKAVNVTVYIKKGAA